MAESYSIFRNQLMSWSSGSDPRTCLNRGSKQSEGDAYEGIDLGCAQFPGHSGMRPLDFLFGAWDPMHLIGMTTGPQLVWEGLEGGSRASYWFLVDCLILGPSRRRQVYGRMESELRGLGA